MSDAEEYPWKNPRLEERRKEDLGVSGRSVMRKHDSVRVGDVFKGRLQACYSCPARDKDSETAMVTTRGVMTYCQVGGLVRVCVGEHSKCSHFIASAFKQSAQKEKK